MKTGFIILFLIFGEASLANASGGLGFKCRDYKTNGDHIFQLRKGSNGKYNFNLSNNFTLISLLSDLTCLGSSEEVDSLLVSCGGSLDGFNYVSLSRVEHTSILSPYSSEAGKTVRNTMYEMNVYSPILTNMGAKTRYSFGLKDCERL